jgi:hypothetical protein
MNPGIYGLGGRLGTPVPVPFSGVADAGKLRTVQVLIVGGGGGGGGEQAGGGGGGRHGNTQCKLAQAAQVT